MELCRTILGHKLFISPCHPKEPSQLLASNFLATLLRQPAPWASQEFDRLLTQLEASGITLSPAHTCTLVAAATLRADIRDCWAVLKDNGGAYTKAGTGAVKLHPAAARLDVLRRDLLKALGLLGLQKPIAQDPSTGFDSLEEALAD